MSAHRTRRRRSHPGKTETWSALSKNARSPGKIARCVARNHSLESKNKRRCGCRRSRRSYRRPRRRHAQLRLVVRTAATFACPAFAEEAVCVCYPGRLDLIQHRECAVEFRHSEQSEAQRGISAIFEVDSAATC